MGSQKNKYQIIYLTHFNKIDQKKKPILIKIKFHQSIEFQIKKNQTFSHLNNIN